MIPRYLTSQMRDLWSEATKFQTWLQVEQAVAKAQAKLGIIPSSAAQAIAHARFDLRSIERFERETRHDVIAFLQSVQSSLGPDAAYLHYGLTSYDIVDTALALRCRRGLGILIREATLLRRRLRNLAIRYRDLPMIGRTHGVHAEPITLGLKFLSWYEECQRNIARLSKAQENISYGKISGAVGTYSQLPPQVEALALRTLGLLPEPVSTQVVPRDRLAEVVAACALMAAGLERIALEVRNLQRTEIGELSESFAPGQRGSSAMPHKQNPITCEQICGLARVLRAHVSVALENIPLWHERDLTNSAPERIVVPDTLSLLHYLLEQTRQVLSNLVVNRERIARNLMLARGQYYSQTLMLALIRAGMSRDDAYQLTQRLSFEARDQGLEFGEIVARSRAVREHVSSEQLAQIMDIRYLLRNTKAIFQRVLGPKAMRS